MTALAETNTEQVFDDRSLKVYEIELCKNIPQTAAIKNEDKISSCVVLASDGGMRALSEMFNACKPEASGVAVWLRLKS